MDVWQDRTTALCVHADWQQRPPAPPRHPHQQSAALRGCTGKKTALCSFFSFLWYDMNITLCPLFPSFTVSLPKVNGTAGPSIMTSPARQRCEVLPLWSFPHSPALNFTSLNTLAHHVSSYSCGLHAHSCAKLQLAHQFFMIALSATPCVSPKDRLVCILIRIEMTRQLFFQLRT